MASDTSVVRRYVKAQGNRRNEVSGEGNRRSPSSRGDTARAMGLGAPRLLVVSP